MTDSEDLLNRLASLEGRVKVLEERLTPHSSTLEKSEKPLSIREFLLSVNPKNDVEKTLYVGHYIEAIEHNESFDVADLRDGFSRAKEKRPSNLNDAVNKNIRKGFMMPAGSKKSGRSAWVLTNLGENFVASNRTTSSSD